MYFQDVQAAAFDFLTCGIDCIGGFTFGVAVAGAAADALVAAGAKCPAAVFFTRAIAGEQHRSDIRGTARVVEYAVELIDGMRAKGIAYFRAVKGNAHDAIGTTFAHVAVVGDIGEVRKAVHRTPLGGVKRIIGAISSGCSHAL
ncbi:hypothetical protein HMPREF0281_01681 [Corynebacterium ammoniagenes DSM 20306]|uniref:Uncharacterized protein n=1 Tax=Corynebacterium ammoniagenes DSM 20306 TaxID=649754 RepID=A0ABP2IIC0_CORAM|nr:hypothetical protein HMPREF0281_01681 [Corynebacterium ammoniagenes DSM 20306]